MPREEAREGVMHAIFQRCTPSPHANPTPTSPRTPTMTATDRRTHTHLHRSRLPTCALPARRPIACEDRGQNEDKTRTRPRANPHSARDLARGRAREGERARAEAARLPAGRPDSRPLRAKFSRKHLDLPRTQLDAGARHDQERCLRPRLVPVSAKVVLQVSYSV